MNIQQGTKITREYILDRVQEVAIFERYLDIKVVMGLSYTNPLRRDDSAGCRFYIDKKDGRLRFNDFSRGKTYDCFDIVQERFYLTFPQARDKIAEDFGLRRKSVPIIKQRHLQESSFLEAEEAGLIKVATRPFRKDEVEYWKQYGITGKQVRKFKVFAVRKATFNRPSGYTRNIYIDKGKEKAFAYFIEGEWKVYFPDRKEDRFYQVSQLAVQGYEHLPKTGKSVVITKSYKDVIGYDVYNIPAVAPQSENITLTKILMAELKRRFENVYIMYDNDFPGMRAMIKAMQKYPHLQPLLFPKGRPKDLTDNMKLLGVQKVGNAILQSIKL